MSLNQVFNEFNARQLHNNVNIFKGLKSNPIFVAIIFITIGLQVLIVMVGGPFVKTAPMGIEFWGWSLLFGFISWPWGFVLRVCFPLNEDPRDFFGYEMPSTSQPVPSHLEGKVHQAYDKVAPGDGNNNNHSAHA